ncbi:hypothetical protein [Metamycoplasma hominis]|uniref:hypothetical protein n=1 Tax=Metamycoplasma hominis TaxID=2098 RepID=UPI001E46122B|nr:hypothetical protein [Metamycoplasma hominis]
MYRIKTLTFSKSKELAFKNLSKLGFKTSCHLSLHKTLLSKPKSPGLTINSQ